MPRREDGRRAIWSCQLCELPEENERSRLEELLLSPDRSCWTDAENLRRYIDLSGLSQSACAARLGRSQASVANRLRLLKLPEDVRERMASRGLTERHARALLRLPTPMDQRSALEAFLQENMNVASAEEYVEEVLSGKPGIDEHPELLRPLFMELEKLQERVPGFSARLERAGDELRLTILFPDPQK